MFPTNYTEILKKIDAINPYQYAQTRNHIDGAVTRLSPYISRGVISTKMIRNRMIEKGYDLSKITRFLQELAWRDYFQQVWKYKGDLINQDLKTTQQDVDNEKMPAAIINATTGIKAIDKAIQEFYLTGYMHNHLRMYVASLACNWGKSHWKTPAKWMYFHLIDGDWASNALSWQWVAGAFSSKKYIALQENINNHCYTSQKNTCIDFDYNEVDHLAKPSVLSETTYPSLKTFLPEKKDVEIDPKLPTLIYNLYNMDPLWKNNIKANRILLLEPSHFANYPVSEKTIHFVLRLTENVPGIQVFAGEFYELSRKYDLKNIYYKEHPFNKHYRGKAEPREWMFDTQGYFPSFFSFWKNCEKECV